MNQREQDWQYLCLYKKHGEYSAAAREAGVNVSSFKRRIKHYMEAGVMVEGQLNHEVFNRAELYKGANVSRREDKAPAVALPIKPAPVVAQSVFTREEVATLKSLVRREQEAHGDLSGGAMRTGQEKVQSFRIDTGVFAAFQTYCKESGVKMGRAITTAVEEYLERRKTTD